MSSAGGGLTLPAAYQVGGQAVDRLQHGETPQGGLDSPRRGGPGRVLVVGVVRHSASAASPAAKGESPWFSRWTGWSWSRAKRSR